MTLQQIQERVARLETEVADLRESLETQRSIEGVGRGLRSKAAGKSLPARSALTSLRKELFLTAKPRRAAKRR